MSINMSNVKAITLGGLNVKKIEDKNGNVLWKKSSATIDITIGSGQDIVTSQYYNRIAVPSLTTIKSAVANKASISESNIVSIDTVELALGFTTSENPSAVKHLTSSARDTKIRFFLVLGNTITSTVLVRGYNAYTVDFTSGNFANKPIKGAFFKTSTGTSYIDITSYLSETSVRYIYGGYAMGTTEYNSQTPLQMFGTSSNSGVHMCGGTTDTRPTFTIRVSYSCIK